MSFCKFVIQHLIYILWLDSNHSTAKYLNSFHSNSNLSKYFLCIDYHESENTYHRRRYCNLLQFYILVFISRSEMYFFFLETREKIMQRMLYSIESTRTLKLIETINSYNDKYEFLNVQRWRIMFQFLINNEYFNIFDFNKFVNVLLFISSIYFSFDLILFYIY